MAWKGLEIVNAGLRPAQCLARWRELDVGRRIWAHDPGLWRPGSFGDEEVAELSNRLGWLDLPAGMGSRLPELEAFARQVKEAGFTRAVVLGMGGSSLIAEVWAAVFGPAPGCLPVSILDSTHPRAVAALASAPLEKTLFLVASKSGGTVETLSFCNFFYDRLAKLKSDPGANFVALTDPGSKLEILARERAFRKVFSTPPKVGGRFSALTEFGLVPAALLGLPLAEMVGRARVLAAACGPEVPVADNPALKLGAFLGSLAAAGRDKLCLLLGPRLRPFAVWLEQLLAESLGKMGRGLVPVAAGEGEDSASLLPGERDDRLALCLTLAGDESTQVEAAWQVLLRSGVPAARLELDDVTSLAAETWRFEMATAAAAIELGINPFDQPDVEAAKIQARQALAARRESGALPAPARLGPAGAGFKVSGSRHFSGAGDPGNPLARLPALVRPGDYLALLAYLPPFSGVSRELEKLRLLLAAETGLPVTVGFGPRYLHSTGQLHKGGPDNGIFLILAGDLAEDLPLPGEDFGFATLVTAQFRGDFQALVEAGRRVLLVEGPALSGPELVAKVRHRLEGA